MAKIMDKIKALWTWIRADRKRMVGTVIVIILLIFAISKIIAARSNQVQYQTAKVEKGTIVSSVSASGSVIAANFINVTSQATGIVDKVFVKDGDTVYKGQRLAQIILDADASQKNASAYASYLGAKNNLENAKIAVYTLQSAKFAANQKFINDAVARELEEDDPTYIQQYADWKAAEAKYLNQQNVIDQSQASLASASLSLQAVSSTVVAPMSGKIGSLTLVAGMTLTSSNSTTSNRVAVIEIEGKPILSFNLAEVDVPRVKVGQKATVTIDSLPDKTFTGKVMAIDRVGTTTNNVTNYSIIIQLDTTSSEILPNMSASANIIIEAKDSVLLVPSEAVQSQNGENFVRILVDDKEQNIPVEIGISSDTQTEIVSGVKEGDEVVTGTVSSSRQTTSTSPFSSFGGAGGLRTR